MITTWKFRIKDSGASGRLLNRMARSVNVVWNFCKATQRDALRARSARLIEDKKTGLPISVPNFLSAYEFNHLVAGSSKELGLHSQSVQAVCEQYSTRRKQFGKLLRWRGRKNPGWIPWKSSGIKLAGDSIIYVKHRFRFWKSREFPSDAKIKMGSFSQDKRGRWYVSVTFESAELEKVYASSRIEDIGIDLGIKSVATLSNGEKIRHPRLRTHFLKRMSRLEKTRRFARRKAAKERKWGRFPKTKQEKTLHAKIANTRQDHLHKESTRIAKAAALIIVGDLNCAFMNRNKRLSGASYDAGIGQFRSFLRYKANRAGVEYLEVSERESTQTCSNCGWQHPQRRRIGLDIREWTCENCGSHHDRDVNAARNILRTGRGALTQCFE